MLLDTNFLITCHRGSKDVPKDQARAFLEAQGEDTPFYISRVAWMEFMAGFATSTAASPHLKKFTILEVDNLIWWDASRVVRNLGLRGKKIGAADSIIAATALNYGLPLVSNNTKHFSLVPGLDLRSY
ncbi:MAG: type II toxin-antitoxin system VapC family toxin [Verrucomicrobiota bacterium]